MAHLQIREKRIAAGAILLQSRTGTAACFIGIPPTADPEGPCDPDPASGCKSANRFIVGAQHGGGIAQPAVARKDIVPREDTSDIDYCRPGAAGDRDVAPFHAAAPGAAARPWRDLGSSGYVNR